MSIAARRSHDGDEYQLKVALHWLIRMLSDDDLEEMQVESAGWPGEDMPVTVDDVVIRRKDGRFIFIQAKKNQPDHNEWKLSDPTIKEELVKAHKQLESCPDGEVCFYSRTPFGELKKLAEACRWHPDYPAFERDAAKNQKALLAKLSSIVAREPEQAFDFALKIKFGSSLCYEDLDDKNLADLARHATKPKIAIMALEKLLRGQQSSLQSRLKHTFTRTDVVNALLDAGCLFAPMYDNSQTLALFASTSKIGREWTRDVGGVRIPRPQIDQALEAIATGKSTVLIKSRPGAGKTCLLLDLADRIEAEGQMALLFIRGDSFETVEKEADLTISDIPGRVARLAERRKVVVVIDSLDVLSISRNHASLKVFISIMDRLKGIERLTLVAACREFDLTYDQNLRHRKWDTTIDLGLLDFYATVSPILASWGVSNISPALKELLRVPQNLRLFWEIRQKPSALEAKTEQDLTEAYLREVVEKNPSLGAPALELLSRISVKMLQKRATQVPDLFDPQDSKFIQGLKSAGVLRESGLCLAFGHQTLSHCLAVRSALMRGETLHAFLRKHEPLPFLRPAVRAFFLYLRAFDPKQSLRDLRKIFDDKDIAYHLKRLLVESFAEVEPSPEDKRFALELYTRHHDLFKRFFWQTKADGWFFFLKDDWLPKVIKTSAMDDWQVNFVYKLEIWSNTYPVEVVALLHKAIDGSWSSPSKPLTQHICHALNNFISPQIDDFRKLLETLLAKQNNERFSSLLKAISRWVEASDSGDDLLWRAITKWVDWEVDDQFKLAKTLKCSINDLHSKTFLTERLCLSDNLLDLVLKSLVNWQSHNRYPSKVGYLAELLNRTSWAKMHKDYDFGPADPLVALLDALETALKHRSKTGSTWWQNNEPRLRSTPYICLRYLIIQAYRENPEINLEGISEHLQDFKLFRYGHLQYELGILMRESYHLLTPEVQEFNQHLILGLYADSEPDKDRNPEWDARPVYDLLIVVPPMFRIPQTIEFINKWGKRFAYSAPIPVVYGYHGTVRSPVTYVQLLALSDVSVEKILLFYQNDAKTVKQDDGIYGGRESLAYEVKRATENNPERFLGLLSGFSDSGMHFDYREVILEGVANHISYRFGNLQPQPGWKSIEPKPDGPVLARRLLEQLAEDESSKCLSKSTVSRMLEACCFVLRETFEVERSTKLISKVLSRTSVDEGVDDDESLENLAICTPSGTATEAAVALACNLLEADSSLPKSLVDVLRQAASHPSPVVRCMILHGNLAFLEHKVPGFGWELFEAAMTPQDPRLWEEVERFLYYHYTDNYQRVRPWLNRMKDGGNEKSVKSWGRLMTFCCLAGHITLDELWSELNDVTSEGLEGAISIFCANIGDSISQSALMTILMGRELSEEVFHKIDSMFEPEANDQFLSDELALAYLNAPKSEKSRREFYHFMSWIERKARRDPAGTMAILEVFAARAEQNPQGYFNNDSLISAITEVLREADERDDVDFIKRAVALQDRFLRLDLYGIDKLFDLAGQA